MGTALTYRRERGSVSQSPTPMDILVADDAVMLRLNPSKVWSKWITFRYLSKFFLK